MKLWQIVIALILVFTVCILIIWFFIYKTTLPPTGPKFNENQTLEIQNTIPTSTENIINQSVPKESDLHDPLEECIAFKTNEANGKNYVKGSLLVVFDDSLDFQTAIQGILFYKLSVVESPDAEKNFYRYHWLEASVPENQEFKWQCLLETGEGIKRTLLNASFPIHE